jgi:hypothetical protein
MFQMVSPRDEIYNFVRRPLSFQFGIQISSPLSESVFCWCTSLPHGFSFVLRFYFLKVALKADLKKLSTL